MQLLSRVHIRRTLSILAMVLLIFVQMVKVLHKHHHYEIAWHDNTGHHLQPSHDCAICDYHLLKDAVLPGNISLPKILSTTYSYLTFQTTGQFNGEIQISAGRDPPSV